MICWRAMVTLAFTPLLLASGARAERGGGSYLSLALTRTLEESRADTEKGKNEILILNATAAWMHTSGFVLGAKYFDYAQNGQILSTTSGTVISAYGLLGGYYHASGVFGHAAYLYKPTKRINDAERNDASVLKGGDGYVFDLGKVFEFGGWGVGLQMTYAKVSYKKAEIVGLSDEQSLTGTWTDELTYPFLAGFIFF